MLTEHDYISRDAIGMAELVRGGEVKPEELLEAAIHRAERLNPEINAIVTKMYDLARSQIAAGLADGPLRGVPFLLKDLRASYKGVQTSAGNAWMASVPDFDSEITLRFKKAGLVIVGKTNVPELGLSIDTQNRLYGSTRNPWNPKHSAGGSSGGSAAAVAARIVPAAHATDGGGSTRVPSSNCGLFGLKTSKGRATYAPDVGEELIGLSTQHVTTLSVRDSALLLDIDGVPDYGDPYFAPPRPESYLALLDHAPRPLRIALTTRPPNGAHVHPDCVAGAEKAARLCESLGHHVELADPNIDWESGYGEALNMIFGVGMNSNVQAKAKAKGVALKDGDFSPSIQKFLDIGVQTSSADYYQAVKKAHSLSRLMAKFHETYDILLSPTMTTPPLPLEDFVYDEQGADNFISQFWAVAAFMPLANMTGQPSMTVPLHASADGLPVGVLFTARYGAENVLLPLARQLELAAPWFDSLPPLARLQG